MLQREPHAGRQRTIAKLREKGLTWREIGAQLGITEPWARAIHRAGDAPPTAEAEAYVAAFYRRHHETFTPIKVSLEKFLQIWKESGLSSERFCRTWKHG